MKLALVYKICPVLIRYVDTGTRGYAGVCCFGVYIKIKKSYKDDAGLLAHELTHTRQFYRTLGVSLPLYQFVAKFRYKYEVEAYKVQLALAPDADRERLAIKFAHFIGKKYKLTIDEEATKNLLLGTT